MGRRPDGPEVRNPWPVESNTLPGWGRRKRRPVVHRTIQFLKIRIIERKELSAGAGGVPGP